MQQRILLAVALCLALLAVGLGLFWHPGEPTRNGAGGDFTLQSADGPVSLKDFRGKVVLVYFGYTYCPDVCPTELTNTAAALRLLKPEENGRVAVLFVSVDPERDTPAHLKEYVAFFHPAMVGITGTPAEVAAVAKQYGVYYARQANGSTTGAYVVDHSSEVYLVGPDGQLAARIPHAAAPETMAAEIRKQLG